MNFSMAAVLDLSPALSFCICSTSSFAASSTVRPGKRLSPNIPSIATKQAVGEGLCIRKMLSAEVMTAESCTFSVAKGRCPMSSGFFCTAASCIFSVGFSICRIVSGSSRIAFNRAVPGNALLLFNITVCFNYNDMLSGSKVRRFIAIALRYTIKRERTLRISHPECPLR